MRPDILNPLFAQTESLDGVSPKLKKPLEKLGLTRLRDLAYHLPERFVTRRSITDLDDAGEGEQVVIADAHLSNSGEYPPPASDLLEKFVPEEVRREATYVEHEVEPRDATNYRGKTQTALDRLDLYARAKLVITSRLHVALPCLALGTPVVFLNRLWETDPRFEGYRDIIPGYGPDDDEVNVDWDRPGPKDISAFRDQVVGGLAQKVREHVGLL